ncbi:MAG TPA: hypothetical protein VF821_21635 [Lentzea sp.]
MLAVVFATLFTVLVWRSLAVHGAPVPVDRTPHAWAFTHRPPRTRPGAVPALRALAVNARRIHSSVCRLIGVMDGWLSAACWAGTASVVVILLRHWNSGAVIPEERQRT